MPDHDPNDPFRWSEEGVGLKVNVRHTEQVAHEALFEDDITAIKDRPMYVGVPFGPVRFALCMALAAAVVGGLLARAFWMQVAQGPVYAAKAEGNRLRREVAVARRGVIRDRDGLVLAENTPSFDLLAIPWLLPREVTVREARLADVARTAGLDVGTVLATVASSTEPTEEIILKRDIPYDRAIALQILLRDDPGLRVSVGSKRAYPMSRAIPSLSHILGYVGNISPDELAAHKADGYRRVDLFGKTGVESSYEPELRGSPGLRVYEVDAHGRITNLVEDRTATDGSDLYLSLSAELQRAAEIALRERLDMAHATSGVVVAMDPRDGSILAAVSLPSYDNNFFSGGVSSTVYASLLNDPGKPLLPRAWAGTFPSGSTIKPLYALAALAEGVITPKTSVNSVGGIHIGSVFFPDWKAGGHGVTNVRRAIAWSVNTFFYYIGGGYDGFVGMGIDRMERWLRRFGLGAKTGLDIPGEQPGFVPSTAWKREAKGDRWYIGDTYNLSIGQGDLLVTPLQIVRNTAIVANGGTPMRPHVLFGLGDKRVIFPMATGTLAAPDLVQVVREGMRDTVVYGSGRALANFPVPVAGKTGTAQWRKDRANHAWFTAFAPFDTPEIAVTVLIEEGVEGSLHAVPVARKVLEAWYARKRSGRQ